MSFVNSPPGLRGPDEKCCALVMEKDVMAGRCVVKQERIQGGAAAMNGCAVLKNRCRGRFIGMLGAVHRLAVSVERLR
ncbi:hypothetical protein VU08_04130 [Desulfobulbus sp. F5]|nr:hypothetical protein [Desulfobulbus sp. F5]